MEPIVMLACPFCGGPPVVIVRDLITRAVIYAEQAGLEYPDDGLFSGSHVFCHECGATGPEHEEFLYSTECHIEAEREAAKLWNLRDKRNGGLYQENSELNLCPRQSGEVS